MQGMKPAFTYRELNNSDGRNLHCDHCYNITTGVKLQSSKSLEFVAG